MQQLDLFGFAQEESAPAVKPQVKEKPANTVTKTKVAEQVKAEEPKATEEEPLVAAFVQTSILDAVAAVPPATPTEPAPQDNVVFSDNNIKVKIKVKAPKQEPEVPAAESIETPAAPVIEAPLETVIPVVEEALEAPVAEQKITEEFPAVAETIADEEKTPVEETAAEPASAIEQITAPVVTEEPEIEETYSSAEEAPPIEAPLVEAVQEEGPVVAEIPAPVAAEEPVIEQPVVAPKKMTTVIKPEENKILAPVTPKPVVRKTPPPAPASKKRGRKSFKEIDAEVDLVNVPDDDALFLKQYYPISTVATWFNVNTSLLRYWENEFDILKPRKNRKGDRLFRPEDVKTLQTIYYLLRQRKFTIEGAKEYLKSNKRKVDLNAQLVQSLTRFRSFLLELKANL